MFVNPLKNSIDYNFLLKILWLLIVFIIKRYYTSWLKFFFTISSISDLLYTLPNPSISGGEFFFIFLKKIKIVFFVISMEISKKLELV